MTQPTPPVQVPPVDLGNPMLAEAPAILSTDVAQTPGGPRLALTLRVGNGTLTAFLGRDDARAWAAQIEQAADRVSPLLVAGPTALPNGVPPGFLRPQQ